MSLSLIIPVYNRPDEVDELLESLTKQTIRDFEVIIVEDGSQRKCDNIVNSYSTQLNIKYFFKENSGPGTSRNYGAERASGNYFVILDSDCIIPEKYIEIVLKNLNEDYTDAYGGPDKAHKSFSNFQKAVNYSMTSLFTTGGIRGKSENVDKFFPRSFNMGYSKEVFEKTGGFSKMRFGEDIDLSIRIIKNKFKTRLIKDAFVYHKRRTSIKQFFKQVYNSGIARINLYKKYPESLKIVHSFPSVFISCVFLLLIFSFFISPYFLLPVILHILLIFSDSSIKNSSLKIGAVSIITSYIQFIGYGSGFIFAFIKNVIFKKQISGAFKDNFYD
ncbi:MAG: glycosyltransferase [Bacteroidales bacterium]|nr:glycosyltransferase [Bacteroidales bacterium]